MNVSLFNYKCARCSHSFTAAGLGDQSYGEFIMRSVGLRTERYASIADETFRSVEDELGKISDYYEKRKDEKTPLLLRIFGLTCDSDADGSEYKIGLMPRCPICGATEMSEWDAVYPFKRISLPLVTHDKWNSLTHSAQMEIIKSEIAK